MSNQFFIENLGCSKNQVDAEQIIASLQAAGWQSVKDPSEADLIIVNSCGFVEQAKKESLETAFQYNSMYPGKKVLMAGCFAQRYGASLTELMPELDGVFGNRSPSMAGEVVGRVMSGEKPVFLPEEQNQEIKRTDLLSLEGSAYVKLAEGCNNRCSFCAIPLIRGSLVSRNPQKIVDEVKDLLGRGIKEINFVGQDLGAYGSDRSDGRITDLVLDVLKLKGDFWLRLLYIHPDHFPMDLPSISSSDARLLPYYDIPFQHGSQKMLKKMGRKGSPHYYLQLINKIRDAHPEAVIRSTFMTGFPGETAADFQDLKEFISAAELDWTGFFTYSREEGTAAYKMRGSLGHSLSKGRAKKYKSSLESIQHQISCSRMKRYKGTTCTVLIEEAVQGEEDMYLGRTWFQAPEVDGLVVVHGSSLSPGQRVSVQINRVNGIDLEGSVI